MDNQISREEITQKLISIISHSLRIEEDKILPGSGIITNLNADSLDILEIRYSIEQNLGITIDGHELADRLNDGKTSAEPDNRFRVSDLVDFIEEQTTKVF